MIIPYPPSNRNDGRGGTYWKSHKDRKQIESWLRANGHTRAPYGRPVRLELVRVLGPGQRLWDADSVLRGNAKELIDAMVACGWFHDDGPRWVVEVTGRQDSTRRSVGPAWEVIISERAE